MNEKEKHDKDSETFTPTQFIAKFMPGLNSRICRIRYETEQEDELKELLVRAGIKIQGREY